jgi:hypothetical protein
MENAPTSRVMVQLHHVIKKIFLYGLT